MPQDTQQPSLDPKIVNLAKAIRQTESQGNFQAQGKSGEYGAYQFMPSTWEGTAPKYGVNVPLQQATPEQQNEVAYKQLTDWSKEHPDWNVGNFASAWNAGAGKPNAYLEGHVGVNDKGISYDTPAYAKQVATAYQQFKGQAQPDNAVPSPTPQEPAPSVGGFAGNVVKSGANFLGDTANALLHPIQTIQNIGGTAAGALQELGGQQNENTAKFDALKNYFVQKYGGISNIEHSLYTDPISVAGDLSAFLGGAGLITGGASKLNEIGGLSKVADITKGVASNLNKGADLTNPLTPIINGAGTLLKKSGNLAADTVGEITNLKGSTVKGAFNGNLDAETIANTSRQSIANEIKAALDQKELEKSDTGQGYNAIRQAGEKPFGFENVKNTAPANALPVVSNFLEEELRNTAKLDVKDGKISPTTVSKVGKAEVSKLQDILDTFKPSFQRGYITPEEFLTLRHRLAQAAYNDSGIKNTDVAKLAEDIRNNLNTSYRGAIPGLEELDNTYSAQLSELKTLRKGFLDKEGNLLSSGVNKIARALNKGKDADLARLEQISPGITHKLEVLKAVEDIEKETSGTTNSLLRTGGVFGALASGRIELIALSIASTIIDKPSVAIPLIRALGSNKELAGAVIQKLSRYLTLSSTTNKAINTPQENQEQPATDLPPINTLSQTAMGTPNFDSSELDSLAKNKGFDLQGARTAGHTDAEILAFLQKQ